MANTRIPEVNIALDTLVTALPTPDGLSTGPYPAHFQGFINDPNSVLREAIEDQDILGHIEIHMTTDTLSKDGKPTDGIGSLYETVSNIPFLGVATRTPPGCGHSPTRIRFPGARNAGGYCARNTSTHSPDSKCLRLFGKRHLLDRMGAQPGSAADIAA